MKPSVPIAIFIAMFVVRTSTNILNATHQEKAKQLIGQAYGCKSPALSKHCFVGVRSDLPSFFYPQNLFIMRTPTSELGNLCPAETLSAILNEFFDRNSEATTNQRLTDMFGALVGSDCFALTDRLERANYFHTYQELMALVTNLQNVYSANLKAQEATL